MWKVALKGQSGQLELPLGTKFQVSRVTAYGERKMVPLTVGPGRNLYYAVFDEDDVDFELSVDNALVPNRQVCFDLNVHRKFHEFVVPEDTKCVFQTVETNGQKFHFVRLSGEDGQVLVSEAATRHGLSFEDASVMMSQMKFTVQYSKEVASFQVFVRSLDGRLVVLKARPTMTIEDLKDMIEVKEEIPFEDQRLLFAGVQLEDRQTLQDCGIQHGSTVQLTLRLLGGYKPDDSPVCLNAPNFCSNIRCQTHAQFHRYQRRQLGDSERGVICFGDRCGQQFRPADFDPDYDIHIEPFIIEMRMASRFTLLSPSLTQLMTRTMDDDGF